MSPTCWSVATAARSAGTAVTTVADWPLLVAARDASARLTTAVRLALSVSVALAFEAAAQIAPPVVVALKVETLVAICPIVVQSAARKRGRGADFHSSGSLDGSRCSGISAPMDVRVVF
jgi:hypothetical protein